MIETIYFEEDIRDHPTSQRVRLALPRADWFPISKYQELFNKNHQNFRLQKKRPELILAKKHDNFVLPVPTGFGMTANKNFYFSHMLNCIYDCKYCFLQGLYSSANFVLFVNYEDFFKSILGLRKVDKCSSMSFFSGYDCDSLAFDTISGFADKALDFFGKNPDLELELRTKSIATRALLKREPISNCIVAFSLSPANIADALDRRAPSIRKRIKMIKKLAKHGWKIGLRFDPLIYCSGWENLYGELFENIFRGLDNNDVHSVSFGPLRFPKKVFHKIEKLRPTDKLFAFPLKEEKGQVSYGRNIESLMYKYLEVQLQKYTSGSKIFQCVIQ